MKRTYYALTTLNPQEGWNIVAAGHDKQAVAQAAGEALGEIHDIFDETRHKNLTVVSKTRAQREYGIVVHYNDAVNWV